MFLALGPNIKAYPYFWPSMHADETVIEITVDFSPNDLRSFAQNVSDVQALLVSSDILQADEEFLQQVLPDDRLAWYASLLAQTALLFQRKAGHRVSFCSVSSSSDPGRCQAYLEYDHLDVGITAVKLAYELVSGKRKSLAEPFYRFREFARSRALPAVTGAIINAALRRNIPYLQLERYPLKRDSFKDITGDVCICLNGLLMLGHGVHQHVVDGTFCHDKSKALLGMLEDSDQRRDLLINLGIPLIQPDDKGMVNAGEYQLIVVNGQITGVVSGSDGTLNSVDDLHPSLFDTMISINREVGFAPVVIKLLSTDITVPMNESGGGVLDFSLAPDLDQLTTHVAGGNSSLLDSTADALLDWLFPEKTKARMPVIAVTGTNGKTTTSRLIYHVMREAGYKPGLVCTDGISLNGEQIASGDQCQDTGHLKVLTSKKVDAAVLETHHRGLKYRGLAFRWCDIAVCLNVTDDHLGKLNIDTVEQMAEVKAVLPRHARQAAISGHCGFCSQPG